MDRNEEIKKISELLYNEYISNGWKNVSTEGCERQAINYIDVRDLVKKLTLTDIGSMFSAKQMEQAYNDGVEAEQQRCGEFDIENYC
jgi:hypothetical protein